MLLRSLNISLRAGLSFALVALLAVALGGLSLLEMRRMNEQSNQVDQNWLPSIDFDISPIRNVKLRASYGHTIARADYGSLQGG